MLPSADYTATHPVFREVERAFVAWKLDPGEEGGDMLSFFEPREDRILYVVERGGAIVAMSAVGRIATLSLSECKSCRRTKGQDWVQHFPSNMRRGLVKRTLPLW